METSRTDARTIDTFTRAGYRYSKVYQDDNYIVWKMEHTPDPLPYSQYEIWRHADSTKLWVMPGDSHFGKRAWYICGTEERCWKSIHNKMDAIK